jgi:hypothetical protein
MMKRKRCMWAVEGECGPGGCLGCEHGGAGLDPLAELNMQVEDVCREGRGETKIDEVTSQLGAVAVGEQFLKGQFAAEQFLKNQRYERIYQ